MDNKARFMENMITVRYKPCDDFFKYAGGNKTKTDIEDTEKALILQMFNDDSLFKKSKTLKAVRKIFKDCIDGKIKQNEFTMMEMAQFAFDHIGDMKFPITSSHEVVEDETIYIEALERVYNTLFLRGSFLFDETERLISSGYFSFTIPTLNFAFDRKTMWQTYCTIADCDQTVAPPENRYKFKYDNPYTEKENQHFVDKVFGEKIDIKDMKFRMPTYSDKDEFVKEGRAALLNELLGSILFDEGYVFNNCAVYMSDNFPIALNKLAIDTLKKDRENYKKFKKQFFTYADLIMHEANVTISTSTEILDEHKEDLIANLEKNKFAFFEQSLYKDDIFDEVNGKLELTHPRHSRLYNNLRVLLKYDAEKEHHTHRLIPSMTQNQASHANLVQTNFFHWGPFLYPMYDPSFPHILGFSSIGFVMAHEMAHTYAFASRVYPEFEENRQCLLSFYSNQCSEDKKVCIDPELTYVENVADQLGFIWAYSAYKRMESVQDVGKRPRGKKLNKLSNDKMFFLNYAQIMHFYQNWEDYDDKKPHSPSSVRAWGPLANLPAFTNEFKCPKESKYNPKKKCPMFVAQTMVNGDLGNDKFLYYK